MTKEEIVHLGHLARITLSAEEAVKLNTDIESILSYVSQINDIVADSELVKEVGAIHNVFRDDQVTNVPNQYTDKLLDAMPQTEGRYMKVKKILHIED